MASPGLATHTLVGLCVVWMPSSASTTGILPDTGKTAPPTNKQPSLLQQHPVQAPSHQLNIEKTVFDLAVAHGMPRAGHPHTGRALCAMSSRGGGSTRQPQCTEPCQCVSDQPWVCHGALQGQMQPLQCGAGVMEPALGAAAELGRWFVGATVLPVLWCCFPEEESVLSK